MPKYSYEPDSAIESAKARGSSLRAHFKHCREVTTCIKGMKLAKAKSYLEDVLQFKQAVTFTKFTGGVGRHAQGKLRNAPGSKCRWPVKATGMVLDLLKNAEANAEMKGLDADDLFVKHAMCNRAQPQRRRTYRAHGASVAPSRRLSVVLPSHCRLSLAHPCRSHQPLHVAPGAHRDHLVQARSAGQEGRGG